MEILLLASLETEQSVIRKGGVYCTSDVDTKRTGVQKVDPAPSHPLQKSIFIYFYLPFRDAALPLIHRPDQSSRNSN
jgi:hypothetical protein